LSTVTPFVLLGASALAARRASLLETARAWRSEWGVEVAELTVSCLRASEPEAPPQIGWQECRQAHATLAWCRAEGHLAGTVERAMFRHGDATPASRSSMAAQVSQAALDDLITRLLRRPGVSTASGPVRRDPGEPPAGLFSAGAGAIDIRVSIGDAALRIIVPYIQEAAPLAAHSAATKMMDAAVALSHASVTVSAEIGSAEIEIGDLQTLAAGDVIRLGRGLDTLVALVGSDGIPLCRGHLGTRDGTLALEITT
jgi:flagellar motor switch/type III secretory pathway protein FliN